MAEQIRRDVVELTLLAAEKVTGKTLDADDQRRLIDETIDEARRQAAGLGQLMGVAHRIYAEALLEAAKDKACSSVCARIRASRRVVGSDELRGFLRNPQIEPDEARRARRRP